MPLPYTLPHHLDEGGFLMALTDAQQTQLLTTVLNQSTTIAALATKVADLEDRVKDIQIQARGIPDGQGGFTGWPQLGTNHAGQNRTPVDFWAAQRTALNIPNGTP